MSLTPGRRFRAWLPTASLAVVCYVPLLFTHTGEVGADTKSYLYLSPGQLLSQAWSMWDPNVGLGTVTHQNIGYLWPMGPFYWFFAHIGVPTWMAQRLWLGSILFLAGLGVRYLMRTLGQSGVHVTASMYIYALSPYVLTLAARISALLLPFVGLPWMIGLVIRASRDRTWFHPALFALLVPTVGSTNATALILAGLGPVLWLPFAVFVLGELTIRQALGVLARIGVLTVGTSLWWMAGLYCQGSFGINVLKYSETAKTVADPATAPELLRGLGYWFFYGDDKIGPWIEPSVPYTQSLALILATYALSALGLLAAGFVRWRYRAFFVGLVIVGLVAGVGAHPWNNPTLWGKGVKAFLASSLGLAMRSLPRAVPLLALGLAVLAGMGIAAVAAWAKRMARPLTLATVVLTIGCLPPLWTGQMVANNLQRPEKIPDYWTQDAAYLSSRGKGQSGYATRILEMPGSDFASYRWGNTVDPILPGLTDRPYVARELIPYGTPISADLLDSFDGQLQAGVLDPAAIAPIARFMGVGDINIRSDLQYERYNLARPRQTWALFTSTPGLAKPVGFGGNSPNIPDPAAPLEDEQELASPPNLPNPPKVAAFGVTDPEDIIRAIPGDAPVIMAGSGEGLVDAAGAGLLSGKELVVYSASLAGDPKTLDELISEPDSTLVLTDTNRREATRWGTVYDNGGYTEMAGEKPLVTDLTDNRLPEFPKADDDGFTVAQQRGGVQAEATSYGNPVTYTPEDRADNAVDGDVQTAWTVGGFSPVNGERIQLTYAGGVTADSVKLVQANQGVQNRWITKVALRFDDGPAVSETLGIASRNAPGQVVDFGKRTFHQLSIEITDTDVGHRDTYDNLSAVGFADIALGHDNRTVDEVIRLPKDLMDAAGKASAEHPLAIVLTRLRSRPTEALRNDEELAIVRTFGLPTTRDFTVTGQARISTRAPEPTVDKLLGITSGNDEVVAANSSRRLAGDIASGAAFAIDGNPATHYSPGFLSQVGDFVTYKLAKPITFDSMNLTLVNDGRHSLPTELGIKADGKLVANVAVPAVPDQRRQDGTVTVPLHFRSVTGDHISVVIEAARDVKTNDWISKMPIIMPVGLAELGIPGLHVTVPSGNYDSGCRNDLLSVDGKPVPVRVTGTMADAIAGNALKLTTCSGRALRVPAGNPVIRTAEGKVTGIDVDQLLLTSPSKAGRPVPTASTPTPGVTPSVRVTSNGRDGAVAEMGPRKQATWLVLGQSESAGFKATINGKSLGPAVPVDGYANGWLIPAGSNNVKITMYWTPQRVVLASIIASIISVLICGGLVFAGLRGRRRRRADVPALPGDQPAPFAWSTLYRSVGAAPSIQATVLVTLMAGTAAAAVIGPVSGVVVAACTLAAMHWRRARFVTVVGAAASMAAAGLFTAVSQYRHRLPAGFAWPTYFEKVHQLAYVGVALLVVDLVVDRLWTGRWGLRTDADHATAELR